MWKTFVHVWLLVYHDPISDSQQLPQEVEVKANSQYYSKAANAASDYYSNTGL